MKLGDDMNGFAAEGSVETAADILSWLQNAIATHYATSKYHVEQMGGRFTPVFVQP